MDKKTRFLVHGKETQMSSNPIRLTTLTKAAG
jgi:hypothetical protein